MSRARTEGATAAALRIFEAYAKWLMDRGIGAQGATRILRAAYARVGRGITRRPKDMGRVNYSRISTVTGLRRAQIPQLLEESDHLTASHRASDQHRAQRVLTGWETDRDFQNKDGSPALLPMRGRRSFASLVRKYSGDARVETTLEELEHAKAVRRRGDGRLQMLRKTFATARMDAAFGEAIAEHIEVLMHNADHPRERLYVRRVESGPLNSESAELLRLQLAQRADLLADNFSEEANDPLYAEDNGDTLCFSLYLARHKPTVSPDSPESASDAQVRGRRRKKV